jgi:hypothetical protein
MVHGQPANEAERLAGGAQRLEGELEIVTAAGQAGEEFLFAHGISLGRKSET